MDYSKLSDQEINLLVAKYLGRKTEPTLRENSQAVYERLEGGWGLMHDYCNSPVDAWPIITENRIGIIPAPDAGKWKSAHREVGEDDTPHHFTQSDKPLRAAMIVFLMMQESTNVQDNPA